MRWLDLLPLSERIGRAGLLRGVACVVEVHDVGLE
jgi:hypothetical protein